MKQKHWFITVRFNRSTNTVYCLSNSTQYCRSTSTVMENLYLQQRDDDEDDGHSVEISR